MTDDVVAELDAWLAENVTAIIDCTVVRRARDEIVALRASLDRHDRLVIKAVAVATPAIRNEALEEAAGVCDALYDGYSTATTDQTDPEQVWLDACDRAATAIRKLKERGV